MRVTTAALLLVASFTASAAVINGSFEPGGLAGWNTTGDTSVQSAAIGIAPRVGTSMALLTTLCDSAVLGSACATTLRELPYSGINAVPTHASELQGFFGYSLAEINALVAANPGRSAPAGEGSAISQAIAAAAGDVLSFDYYYLTTEAFLNADNAFVTLIPAGGGPKTLVFLNPAVGTGVVSPVDLCHRQVFPGPDPCGGVVINRTNDWQHFELAIPIAGNYTFGFGLWEIAEDTVPSALFIDDVRVAKYPSPASLC